VTVSPLYTMIEGALSWGATSLRASAVPHSSGKGIPWGGGGHSNGGRRGGGVMSSLSHAVCMTSTAYE